MYTKWRCVRVYSIFSSAIKLARELVVATFFEIPSRFHPSLSPFVLNGSRTAFVLLANSLPPWWERTFHCRELLAGENESSSMHFLRIQKHARYPVLRSHESGVNRISQRARLLHYYQNWSRSLSGWIAQELIHVRQSLTHRWVQFRSRSNELTFSISLYHIYKVATNYLIYKVVAEKVTYSKGNVFPI